MFKEAAQATVQTTTARVQTTVHRVSNIITSVTSNINFCQAVTDMNVAGMNVVQQENERYSARASMENNVNIEDVIKAMQLLLSLPTSYEMDDKLFTTNVIVEVLIEIVTEFQRNPECARVKAAFLLIVLSEESGDKNR